MFQRVFMWQLETQFFASSYIWLEYIFEASYSKVVTSVSKKSSVDQLELDKWVVSHCQTYYMFRHNFVNTVNPLRSCYLEIESAEYYIIRCHNYANFREILMNELNSRNSKFNTLELDELIRTILYADKTLIMIPILRTINFV